MSAAKQRIARHLALAERLGAQTQVLLGADVASTLLEHARVRNVSKIIVGKSIRPWWRRALGRSFVEVILDGSGDIDVYVIQGRSDATAVEPPSTLSSPPVNWSHYLATAIVVAICGLLGWLSQHWNLAEANRAMVFLLGVVIVAIRYGRGPAITAAIANVLVFDFFFVPPYLSFSVSDAQYLFTFGVMLGIGLLISTLTAQVRERLRATQQQEQRTAALYRLTKQMSEVVGTEFIVQIAGRQIGELFGKEVVVFVRDPGKQVELRFGAATSIAQTPINAIVAQWVADNDKTAGFGTDTLPNATALFAPLTGSQRTVGAVGVRPENPEHCSTPSNADCWKPAPASSLSRLNAINRCSKRSKRVSKRKQNRCGVPCSVPSHTICGRPWPR